MNMVKTYWFLIFHSILLAGCHAIDSIVKVGYQYVPEADTWLRLHIEPLIWSDARLRCHLEGGTLASPKTDALSAVMLQMLAANKMTNRHAFIGVHSLISKGEFMSMDGIPFANLSLRWAEGEPNNVKSEEDCVVMNGVGKAIDVSCNIARAYFCRKESSRMVVNKCGTTADGYKLEPRTGSCYKFHRLSRIWSRASMTCQAEGGHLAVINSNAEAQVLKEIFGKNPANTIKAGNANEARVGFWDWNERGEFLTIFDQRLSEAGYEVWGKDEPNNLHGQEFCGSIQRDGKLNDYPCDRRTPFICEITPN